MSDSRKVVLITGCSEGGLGDSLARAFHARGLRTIATARNPAKIAHFKKLGIETLVLDVLDANSIAQCVKSVQELTGGKLDILVNNSGGGYSMPLAEADIEQAKKLYDLNVWASLAVTQAFLPLLLATARANGRSGAIIVNNTSLVAVLPSAYSGIYNSSKAAATMLNDNLRLELAPFNIKVVDLKTGGVRSRFFDNLLGGQGPKLKEGSLYEANRETVEKLMNGESLQSMAIDADVWAKGVVADLTKGSPPSRIWRGGGAQAVRWATSVLPIWATDYMTAQMGGLDVLKRKLAHAKQE